MDSIAKLSLYDILTMLVSGFLILALFIPIPKEEQTSLIKNYWYLLLVLSYIIGIVYHRLLEWIRGNNKKCKMHLLIGTIFVRNYVEAIELASKSKNTIGDKETVLDEYYKRYYYVMNKPCYSNISFLEAQEAFLRNMTLILFVYCILHGFGWIDNKISSIVFFVEPLIECSNCCITIINLFVLVIPILFARYQTQMKIYKLVWEGAKYYGLP